MTVKELDRVSLLLDLWRWKVPLADWPDLNDLCNPTGEELRWTRVVVVETSVTMMKHLILHPGQHSLVSDGCSY